MNIKEICNALSEKLGIQGLEVNDNLINVKIDDIAVIIEEAQEGHFFLFGLIGNPPLEGGETFANLLLEGNLLLMTSIAATLARNPESGAYILIERVSKDEAFDCEGFSERLRVFADTLENWHNILESYNPVAAEAKVRESESQLDAINALRSGYLQA